MNRYSVRNAMIDALERVSDATGEYYQINHVSPEKMADLEEYLVKWLESIGIKLVV